ncbi:MAG TPA: hypothetical protein VFB81_17915, partial [Myxococcales bacterium]|nr:hypothetical protein [Myxococcales bacterium]
MGCGKKAPRQELRRLVVSGAGEVSVDV